MRTVIVCDQINPHIIRFARMFRDAGHTVGVLPLSPHAPLSLPEGTEILWQPSAPRTSPQEVETALDAMQGPITTFAPDVLFAGPLDTAGYAATRLQTGPVVAVCMAFDILLNARQDTRRMDAVRHTLTHASSVLVDSRFLIDQVRQLGVTQSTPILCVPYGISLNRFAPSSEKTDRAVALRAELGLNVDTDILVLSNRRHDPLYHPMVTLSGFATALRHHPHLFLHMGGTGSMTDELIARAATLGIADRVHFAGWLDQEALSISLAAADIYVSSSSVDGSSISLLQAMVSNLPVIATDIPGNREWVTRSQCGHLVPVGNAQALADTLISMASLSRDARHSLGHAGKTLVRQDGDWLHNSARILQLTTETAHLFHGRTA
ncbi:glycosyltransferase [Pseudodesulfovibrio sp. JC047]|uniref:glycosyltransferase family 4 protein n=1 Tax=Pseudodesulfovibrio sp. JC047 TaxID=2683199 RepID=UPI0013D5C27B|nr:glycosyltransferase family 4 protein [Pseudodesulfovibrio sp. JC047]NDV20644.1 glycosyltransferase [Pseudodesulfovibrio sp. JC047]